MMALRNRIEKLEAAQPPNTDKFVPVFFVGGESNGLISPVIGYSLDLGHDRVILLPDESEKVLQERTIDKFKALYPAARGGLFWSIYES